MRDSCLETSVLLGDPQRIVLAAISKLLGDDFRIVGVAQDGTALIESALQLQPDVIVTDVLPRFLDAEDGVRQIQRAWSSAKIVMLTDRRDAWEARRSVEAGAAAYILKQDSPSQLVSAIRAVAGGVSGILSPLLGAPPDSTETQKIGILTPRQQQVLRLLAEGRTQKEIASIIDVSTRTVEFHKYELMRRLAVRTKAELMAVAASRGLIDDVGSLAPTLD